MSDIENKWYDESLIKFKEYINDTETELSELHKEYLVKMYDVCQSLHTNYKSAVLVVSGISFMAGYLSASKRRHNDIDVWKKNCHKLQRERNALAKQLKELQSEVENLEHDVSRLRNE